MLEPREDLATALVQSSDQEDSLSLDELVTVATGLFGAGFETTAHMLGNGLLAFSRHPDQWKKLVASPAELSAATVDEVLRFESSLIAICRTALEATEIRSMPIAAGEKVLTLIGAANRAPRVFDAPDMFDIERDARKHMSFGGGIHFCAGAELARLEGRIAFQRVADRLPGLRVESGAPAWREGLLFRGVSELKGQW